MSYPRKKEMGQRPEPDDSEPEYISGKRSNPHASPAKKSDKFYTDHGRGESFGEEDLPDEDRVGKGKPGRTDH